MDSSENQANNISLDQVKTVVNEVLLPIPRPWIIVTSAAIVISLFEVAPTTGGPYTVSIRLTSVTVLLLALVWLPFLLKVLALSGRGLKALGGEASFGGLSDFLSQLVPEAEREVLSTMIAATKLTEETSTGSERKKLQELREDLEERLAALSKTGALYEKLRSDMPSGPARTFELTKLMAEARAIAKDTDVNAEQARGLFGRGLAGDRITVVALAQEKRDPEYFPLVIEAIVHSKSAFEQYEALRAAYLMLPKLSEAQKQQLVDAVHDQRSGGANKHILAGTDRWVLSNKILDAIDIESTR